MIDFTQFPSPCYIVEEDLLRRNLSLIRQVAVEADVEIILAFKAFAMWRSFPIFREYINGSTASSLYEARLAFEEFGSRAHTYSPAYLSKEFSEIVRYSQNITFNSLSQYYCFYPLTKGKNVLCGIRVNPEYSEVRTSLYNPCAPGSRFGVTADQLPERLPEGIEGFHCHCLCESMPDELERMLQHLEDKFSKWFPQLKWLNLGGGHLMTHRDYDTEYLIRILKGLHNRYPWLKIILEPGSAFAWQTGVLSSEVVDIVVNHGIRTAILNVSFTCHMPDCLEMPYQPDVRGAEKGVGGKFVYRLGGNSCLSGDFIGMWSFDHELQPGERIVFEDMIHYTTVKTNMFNGIQHPAIAMWTVNEEAIVFKQFDYSDYRNRMS